MLKAVLLAGGQGRRLAPYTTVLPKPLIPVGEMPILEIVIRQLKSAGFQEVTICAGYLGSLLEAYFGDGSRWDLRIRYAFEEKPLGTAGPIAQVEDLTEPFLVMNGDLLTTLSYDEMLRFHRGHEQEVTIGLHEKKVKIDLGVVETRSDQTLEKYIEKPELTYLVSMGIYAFSPSIVPKISQALEQKGKLDLPDLMVQLMEQNQKIMTYQPRCEWLDIGRPEDHAVADRQFEENRHRFLGEPRA